VQAGMMRWVLDRVQAHAGFLGKRHLGRVSSLDCVPGIVAERLAYEATPATATARQAGQPSKTSPACLACGLACPGTPEFCTCTGPSRVLTTTFFGLVRIWGFQVLTLLPRRLQPAKPISRQDSRPPFLNDSLHQYTTEHRESRPSSQVGRSPARSRAVIARSHPVLAQWEMFPSDNRRNP
jgi:hypothetical protein